jgi:hypothetical protein
LICAISYIKSEHKAANNKQQRGRGHHNERKQFTPYKRQRKYLENDNEVTADQNPNDNDNNYGVKNITHEYEQDIQEIPVRIIIVFDRVASSIY